MWVATLRLIIVHGAYPFSPQVACTSMEDIYVDCTEMHCRNTYILQAITVTTSLSYVRHKG